MANPHRGEVTFEADGKQWTLAYSINALCVLEDALGMGIGEVVERFGNVQKLRLNTVRAVLWAGLNDHHPEVSLKQAGELIADMTLPTSIDLLGRAFSLAFPDGKDESGNPPQPGGPTNGIGPGSTVLGQALVETKSTSGGAPRAK